MRRQIVMVILILCMGAAPAVASPALADSPLASATLFGQDVQPLEQEELETVEGGYKQLVLGAAIGCVVGTTDYLMTTPRESWSWVDLGRNFVSGAITGALAAAFGR